MLNAYLLASCICVLVAATLYTFYWNRLFAAVIGLLLRIRFWNQGGSSIWIQIGSIHFSLLSGRILLKDVYYHSSNQTINVVKAQITWRYWLRATATEDDLAQEHVGGEDFNQHHSFPPCRIKVAIHGFEWFLYNKTTAYDYIISQMQASAPRTSETSPPRQLFFRLSGLEGLYPPASLTNIKAPPIIYAALNWIKCQMPYIDSKDLLPISIVAFKCAIVCGNASTPTLMVAECHSANGTFGIVPARSRCDLYKQLLNLRIQNTVIHLVGNPSYHGAMPDTGHSIRVVTEASSYADRIPLLYLSHGVFAKVWRGLKLYSSLFHSYRSTASGYGSAHFVPQQIFHNSVDENDCVETDFAKLEYAIERRVMEAPTLEFSYYTDVVGEVPTEATGPIGMGLESYDIGNGDLPPEWGMDFVIHSGVIRYGPWADRQRVHLQRTFFPPTYHDLAVSQRLKPGDKRIWTSMKVFVELRGKTSLILPFREGSKNWQWDDHTDGLKPRTREPAFLHVTAGDSSSISYLVPMVIGPDGYESRLEVHLDSVQVTSSLNDSKLIIAESCRVHAALPAPLQWNSERKWVFTVLLRQLIISVLRDHINMVIDLSRDWTTGPPTEWHQFVPTIYLFEVDLFHFDLNLYANDQNIIYKPLVKDENTIVTLRAPRFHSVVTIPLNSYRPEASLIPFSVEISDLIASVSLPKWNTQSLYNQGKEQRVLRARLFRIQASYYSWAEVHPDKVDQLKLHISAGDVSFKALGWVVRYCMVLRENYFGTFTHFTTLVEYLDKRAKGQIGDPVEQKYRAGKVNTLQVTISLTLQRGSMLLPAGFPGYEKCSGDLMPSDDVGASLLLTFPELQLDLRSHDHFMDMSLNVGETRGCIVEACSEDAFFRNECHWLKEVLIVDGINITANRLFGPPPRTRTYVCVWEISLGSVKALFSILEARIALAVLDAFRTNYTDLANAPAGEFSVPADPDLTFVKLSLETLNATFLVGRVAVDVNLLHGLTIHSNDLQGQVCGKVIVLRFPLASLRALVTSSSSRSSWSEAACMEFDSNVEIYASSRKGVQSNFLQEQDILTRRAHTLLSQLKKVFKDFHNDSVFRQQPYLSSSVHLNNLYLPQLSLPQLCVSASQPQQYPKSDNRFAQLSSLSESDNEDISEADRDARVARNQILRPVAAIHLDEGEQTVSDEDSDNEDLCDTDSSDSDASGLGGRDPSKPLLSRYRHVTRRYEGCGLENLHSREGSAFTLMHSPLFGTFQKPKRSLNRIPRPLLTSPPSPNTNRAIRIESSRGVEIWVTPLIIFVASCLRDEYKQSNISSEILLDSIMVRHLTNFTGSSLPSVSALPSFDITLCSLIAHVAEQVHYEGAQGHPPSEVVTENRSVDLAVHCFLSSFLFRISPQDRSSSPADLHIGCQTLTVSLSNIAGAPVTARPEFSLSLDDIQGSLIESSLFVVCKKQTAQIGPSDPEYIVSFLLAAKKGVDQLVEILHGWKVDSSNTFPVLVRRVLSLTKGHATIDPLSIIQPSLLVQRGLPHAIRTDTSFKFLFNMRFALRICDPLSREDDGAHDDRLLLRSYLSDLIVDLDERAHAPTLEMVYPTANETLPIMSFSITFSSCSFGSLSFTVLSLMYKSHSCLSTTALHLKYQSNSHASTHPLSRPAMVNYPVRQSMIAVDVVDLSLVISPRLIEFIQRVVRVQKWYHINTSPTSLPLTVLTPFLATILVQVGGLDIQAGAENLTFKLGGSSLDLSSSILVRPDFGVQSANTTFGFSSLHLRALSKVNISTHAPTPDILASLTLTKGTFNATQRSDQPSDTLRFVFSLEDVTLSVPRSALRLYRFIEEWKTDFLPGFEIAAGSLMSEIKSGQPLPDTLDPLTLRASPFPSLLLNGTISSCGVILQIMRGTWISWIVRDTTAFISSMAHTTPRTPTTFGFQLQTQTFSIFYKSRSLNDSAEAPRVQVILPALALTGHQGNNNVDLLVALEFANVMLKPSHWDSLLAVQQKFGRDFTDLMDLIQETRRARHVTSEVPGRALNPAKYSMHANIKGFKVGLEGPTSTLYLECKDVVGDTTQKGDYCAWKVQHRDIALSLVPRIGTTTPEQSSRKHRSAFIVVDVAVSADGNRLVVSIPKIHAVMQPSSIGELGDFIDYQQTELLVRRRQRAAELEAFKQKTRTILKTFEVPRHDAGIEGNASWLKHSIAVDIESIGVAFPLSCNQSLELPGSTSHDDPTVRAFVFSVRRIRFNTQKGEVSYMTTKELSFRFTDRFRQSDLSDFIPDNHTTQNCLCYPELKIHLRSDATQEKRRTWVTGNVSGFILDLNSSISDYVFSLIDVYRQGRERMERLASKGTNFQEPESSRTDPPTDDYLNAVPALNVFAALVFDNGQIRIRSSTRQSPPMSDSLSECKGDYESTTDIETIKLPVLSAWIEYRTSAGGPGILRSGAPSVLIFKSKIHSSQNTLNPSLLPFVADITDQVQSRMRKSTTRQGTWTYPVTGRNCDDSPRSITSRLDNRPATSSLQINFSLRIDKSTLELTCQPDVNVAAAIRWDSGGFVVSISPGAHKVTFSGSVDGLSVGLKHGFLSEDCMNLAARNLAFSLAFSKLEDNRRNLNSSISLLVSTDITGGVRFSRLQDILCFKAVWLDRIPVIATQHLQGELSDVAPPLHPHDSRSTQECIAAIVVHIRRTDVTVDLGQSICVVTLNLKELLARTRTSDSFSGVSLSVADISIVARGNISGYIIVPNFIFQTIRRSEEALTQYSSIARLLELTMTSGALEAELESEQQRLLIYRADPIQVDIHDDWSFISSNLGDKDRPLLLAFTVHGQGITALATIATIPKFVLYANRFKASLAAQRLAASRESEAFRATQSPKPSNPLTDVASAFFQSARNRIKEAESEMSHVVRQQMSFRLETLRLILFPRTMADAELASFVGCDVHASLHRTVQDGLPSRREIHLSFTTLNISKFSQLHSFLPTSVPVANDSTWVDLLFKNPTESNIVGLPPMKMLMITEESTVDFTKHLLYDFYSTFQGQGERRLEDIYITLNVALYSWLTGLRKNLAREMDQLTASTNNVSGTRKKAALGIPEPHPTSDQIQLVGDAAQPQARIPSPSSVDAPRTSQETNVNTSTTTLPIHTPLIYEPRERKIQRLTLRQLGEATPDVMHPFFMKKSGFNLEDSLPQYVHEYATLPLEEIMEILLNLYSKQLPDKKMLS